MTFDSIWQQLTRKNPRFEQDDSVIEFTAGNLRRLLCQVYEQGQTSAPCETTSADNPLGPFAEILGGKFGG